MRFRNSDRFYLGAMVSGLALLAACSSSSDDSGSAGAGDQNGDNGSSSSDNGSSNNGSTGNGTGTTGGADAATPPSGGPLPTNLIVSAMTQNSVSIAWTLSTSSDVDHYNVYRNGSLLGKSTTTAKGADGSTIGTYTDSTATNAVSPGFDFPPPTYAYSVSAVDNAGKETAQQTNLSYWMFNTDVKTNLNPIAGNTNPQANGNMNYVEAPMVEGPSGAPSIAGNFIQGNYTCAPLPSQVYNDTSGAPVGTPFDFKFSGCGYNQPYSGPPTVPEYALDLGAFNYMEIDFKPTVADQTMQLGVISRLPQGDVFNLAGVDVSTGTYGPKPVVGAWGHYKIPLKDLEVGKGTFVGSISGNILTVESIASGVDVQDGGWVSGGGLAAPIHVDCDGGGENGGCTAQYNLTGQGQAGKYEVNPAPAKAIASTTFTFQRTDMYKLGIKGGTDVYYLNNIGWSVE